MNKIIFLDFNKNDNKYFEYSSINFSFYTIINLSISMTFDQSIVIISEEFIKANNKLLIYFIQIIEISKIIIISNEKFIEEIIFMIKELKVFESIIKKNIEFSNIINNIYIYINSKLKEIKKIIDFKYINFDYQIFYFIKIIQEIYY